MTHRLVALCALAAAGCTLLFGDPVTTGDDAMVTLRDGGVGDDAGGCGTCTQPPADRCLDDATARRWIQTGTCASGSCAYAHYDVLCKAGCADGACVGRDPCDGVTCASPPAPACVDASTLRTHATSGTCSMGTCTYASSDVRCAAACAGGACVGDPCAGMVCSDPPAARCVDAFTIEYSFPFGTCSLGVCSYVPLQESCAAGCVGGACAGDPCAGIACNSAPAPTCLNATTRRSYAAQGTCSQGTCSYAATDTVCSGGCAAGKCQNDACAGVVCNQPPAASCVDPTKRRSYASPGTCAAGACTYAATDQSCTCLNGACCFGCVSGGACQPGDDNAACGANGSACVACPAGKFCAGGQCTSCIPQGGACGGSGQCCNDGLCSFGGVCNACGGTGTFCLFTTDCCPTTHTCRMNKCVLK